MKRATTCCFLYFWLGSNQSNKTLFFFSNNFMAFIRRFLLTQSKSVVVQKQKNETENSHKNYHYRKNSLARRRNNVKFHNAFSAFDTVWGCLWGKDKVTANIFHCITLNNPREKELWKSSSPSETLKINRSLKEEKEFYYSFLIVYFLSRNFFLCLWHDEANFFLYCELPNFFLGFFIESP